MRAPVHAIIVVIAALAATGLHAQRSDDVSRLNEVLARVSGRVEEWFARAQSIVSTERVAIQPLRSDLTPVDFPRRLAFELRVAWDAATDRALPEATVVRELLTINGRAPRPKDEPGCLDPKPVSPEPLSMLLDEQRDDYRFSPAGRTRMNGREALMIDYRGAAPGPAEVKWTRDCVSISLPGRSRGRVWIDAETFDVLRLDEHLMGLFDFAVPADHVRRGAANRMTIERADSYITYKRVSFRDPEEALMLPASVDTVTVIRGGGVQRYRVSQRFSDYRRFLTDGRLVQ